MTRSNRSTAVHTMAIQLAGLGFEVSAARVVDGRKLALDVVVNGEPRPIRIPARTASLARFLYAAREVMHG